VRDGLIDYELFKKAPDTPQKYAITHVDMKPDYRDAMMTELEYLRGTQFAFKDIFEMECVQKGHLNTTDVRSALREAGFDNRKRDGKMKWVYVGDGKRPQRPQDPFGDKFNIDLESSAVSAREGKECH